MGPPRKRTRLAPLARGSDDSAQPLSSALTQENKEEGLELLDHVKPEPMDEQDPLVVLSEGHLQQQQRSPSPPPPPQNSLFREESGTPFGEGEYAGSRAREGDEQEEGDGFKEEVDDDIKPQLKVSCTSSSQLSYFLLPLSLLLEANGRERSRCIRSKI